MNIDLNLIGEKGLELMEKEILRITSKDRDFFVDEFPLDNDARHYLLCLNSYEASGRELSRDFKYQMDLVSQGTVFERYCRSSIIASWENHYLDNDTARQRLAALSAG